ncbi:MAG TPA: phage tail protein, partial [Oceanobacillus sp.]|nr:phage tail protein [Oceanobacillus sp.]
VQAKDDIVRPLRTLEIIALDDGVETRRWKIKGAWISEISYSDFDSGSSELVQETLVIHYEDVEETWMTTAVEAAATT